MSVAKTYPGVYIEEVPSGVRTITGVATSICAFIGSALRGEENEPTLVQSFTDYQRNFGELSSTSPMGFAVNQFFNNGGRDALIVRVSNSGVTASTTIDTLDLLASSTGEWGNQLVVSITHPDATMNPDAAAEQLFNLIITDNDTGVVETFNNVSVISTHARFVTTVLEQQSKLVRFNEASAMPGTRPGPLGNGTVTDGDPPIEFIGGDNGTTIDQVQVSDPARETAREGIWALEKADIFNLLCIPPFSLDVAGNIDAQTRTAAAEYCLGRRAVFIADPLNDWDEPSDITDPVTGLDGATWGLSRNANTAVYFPRVKQPNPLIEGRLSEFAPCGVIAGIISRTDATRGIWKAPAGLEATLKGVSELTTKVTDGDNGVLNPLAVNCLRAFPVNGRVVWGSRTLVGADQLASEWKYLPVRRTALYIEESLFRGTQWVVFEPNDEPLWAQIRLNVGSFMQNLFRQGAFQGSSPKEAYFVKCDSETTTQNDIDLGIVNILVGFAPLKPAEFVVIKLQQITNQTAA
ncbi:phage tail sheath family protein [Aliikangiella sp. IMCC44359]|uniref:phage tail sheath family protein n=1 Tax=Aliikangiella sp. IMCC44359 TaxID=3459125 RepID=UPI00403B108F